ncbi:MAG: sigma-70 non-essential region-containing protein, partial [Woeseiaceae bacterium]
MKAATILLIEPDDQTAEFLSQAIEGNGRQLKHVRSGKEGLIVAWRDFVDLIIRTHKEDIDRLERLLGSENEIIERAAVEEMHDLLVKHLRTVVSVIRTQERLVMQICVRDAGMPRKDFLASFPKSETDLAWVEKHIRAKRKHSSTLAKLKDDILRAQRKLVQVEEETRLKISEIKEINRQMS